MLLRIDTSSSNESTTLAVSGEIDIDTVDLLRGAITEALQAGARNLLIDLNQICYLDSAGLGVLVGAYKRLGASRGSLTVRCAEPRVLRLFAITGLKGVLHIDETASPQTASEDAGRRVAV